MSEQQLPLTPQPDPDDGPRPKAEAHALSAQSSLRAAMEGFRAHMQRVDFSENTIKSFLLDLGLLQRYLGPEATIGGIGVEDLRAFMDYLRHGRGVPCTPKSYGRRLTALKVFFGWLAQANILTKDPAEPLVHEPAHSPLPTVLYEEQIKRVLEAAGAMMADAKNPDTRPLVLVSLLLQTGMKKSECLALQEGHFDFSDPAAPAVWVRYKDPRRRHKERRLALEPGFPALLQRYLLAYQPRLAVFPCTGRNLEYVLHRVAQAADLPGGISFEMLRWTCAVRDFKRGMEPEQLRRKLGISEITWADTLPKIQALAANAL